MSSVVSSSTADPAGSARHICRHAGCVRWGAWGFDDGQGVADWWCLEHRPDHDPVRPVVEQNWVSDGNEG